MIFYFIIMSLLVDLNGKTCICMCVINNRKKCKKYRNRMKL